MSAGPGRNDPCPCGSGKKYKHCCLRAQEAIAPEEQTWRRVRRSIDALGSRILKASLQHFGERALDEAWAEFTLWEDEEGFDPDTPHMQLFMPWFLYDWLPDPDTTGVAEQARGTTAAQAYVRRQLARLDPVAARYIEACTRAPFSFHEVLASEPGRGFRLRDVLLGTETFVFEESGSAHARRGDMLFGKIVPIEGIAVVDGCGAPVIPPGEKPRIIELRQALREAGPLTPELLREGYLDLFELYHELAERILDPRLPAMQNTDGEPLEFQRLLWDIDDPDEAFSALAGLAEDEPAAELRAEADLDAAGKVLRAEIPWRKPGNAMHESWTNTVLGSLSIDGRVLRAEVNSAARAARLRELIANRLGDRARFRVAKVESPEAALERSRAKPEDDAESRRRAAEHARFAELPEVKAAIAAKLRSFYLDWLDQKIPSLGGRTPREAVADPDGREALEALLLQMERYGEDMTPPLDPAIPRELREALGLAAPR
jgi:hypothetical protein